MTNRLTADLITDEQIKSVRLAAARSGNREMIDHCAIALEEAPDEDEDAADGGLTLNAWVRARSVIADFFNTNMRT